MRGGGWVVAGGGGWGWVVMGGGWWWVVGGGGCCLVVVGGGGWFWVVVDVGWGWWVVVVGGGAAANARDDEHGGIYTYKRGPWACTSWVVFMACSRLRNTHSRKNPNKTKRTNNTKKLKTTFRHSWNPVSEFPRVPGNCCFGSVGFVGSVGCFSYCIFRSWLEAAKPTTTRTPRESSLCIVILSFLRANRQH